MKGLHDIQLNCLRRRLVESPPKAASMQSDHLVLAEMHRGLTSALTKVAWILILLLAVVLPAHAQQSDEVQKQIQQLKQQYEQTTRELQERIAALEQQLKKRTKPSRTPQKKREPCPR